MEVGRGYHRDGERRGRGQKEGRNAQQEEGTHKEGETEAIIGRGDGKHG